jgi:hypothetical protein
MSELKVEKFIDIITLSLSSIILMNYITFFIIFNIYLIKFYILSYIVILLLFIFVTKFNYLYLKISFLFLLLFLLGNPTNAWDGWVVWMFKAKRIFIDQSIFGFLDNYHPSSNNDQPLIVPAFCASIAFFFDKYNEIFPKLGILFTSMPLLIYSTNIFKKNIHFIFTCLSLLIISHWFINGYLDGLVALYFTFCSYLIFNIFLDGKFTYVKFFNLFLFLIILSLLKNEGVVLVFFCFLQIVLCLILKKKLYKKNKINFYLFFCFLPIFLWKIILIKNGISNFHLVDGLDHFLNKFKNIENWKLILNSIFKYHKFTISFALLSYLFFKYKNYFRVGYCLFVGSLYFLIFILVSFLSPMEFFWVYGHSVQRILLTPTYLFCFMIIYEFSLKNQKTFDN